MSVHYELHDDGSVEKLIDSSPDLPILKNGWTHCQFCSNPVPPLEENLTGLGEVYPDPNPMCEDCYDKGLEPRESGGNDLPF